MSDAETKQNNAMHMQVSTDAFQELQSAVDNFQHALKIISQKVMHENVQIVNQTGSSEHPALNAIKDENSMDTWLTPIKKKDFKSKREGYKSKCTRLSEELDYLMAHFRIVGPINNIVDVSERFKKELLDTKPWQSLDMALTATTTSNRTGTRGALQAVQEHLSSVSAGITRVLRSLSFQKNVSHLRNVSDWEILVSDGQIKITRFLNDGDLELCLDYLHSDLFKKLDDVMQDVAGELSTLGRNSANSWLMSEKISDFEQRYMRYTTQVSSFPSQTSSMVTWSDQELIKFKEGCANHKVACKSMDNQLLRLIGHYDHIGVDNEVVEASQFLKEKLFAPLEPIERYLSAASHDTQVLRQSLINAVGHVGRLQFAAYNFQQSLYHQKHTFYFHNVEQWVACLWAGWRQMIALIRENKLEDCLRNMQSMLVSLENAMTGITNDLETFRKDSLPSFLAEGQQRDADLYVNITVIATFFSSVTATTLQFSIAQSSSILGAVVNLSWFLSLVFSVSSGVSSLLGLTWRKSSIYDSNPPPKLIRLWLEFAPMIFLIIAAFSFIIGLNALAFLTSQTLYVSLITNILTALHLLGLLVVIFWFVLELQQDNNIAKWIVHPHQQYKRYLHLQLQLQREFYWAFGNNLEVGRLTYELSARIERTRENPYILSKLIRLLCNSVRSCWSRNKSESKDTEAGAAGTHESDGPAEPLSSSVLEKAREEFREALVDKFGNSTGLVKETMKTINIWENNDVQDSDQSDILSKQLKLLLWGYPELKSKLYREGGLVELRKQMAMAGASSESPEYLLAGHDGGPDLGTEPPEVYYRQRPPISDLICSSNAQSIFLGANTQAPT